MRWIPSLGLAFLLCGCSCGSSHLRSDELDGATLPDRDAAPPVGDGDAGEPAADAGPTAVACAASCSITPLASGYLHGARPASESRVEILAAAVAPGGALHALVSPRGDGATTARRWVLATASPGAGVFSIGDERTWPPTAGSGELEGAGAGLEAGLLRVSDSAIDVVVMFTVRSSIGVSPMDVRVAAIGWSLEGALRYAGEVGTILALGAPTDPDGALFDLPGGGLVAAVEHDGALHGLRLAWPAGEEPAVMEHLAMGSPGTGTDAMAPLSGVAIDDARWAVAGGGRSRTERREAFVHLVRDGEGAWSGSLGGESSDPPPHVVRSGAGALALRWQQNPRDVDDSVLMATRVTDSGPGERFIVPTPLLPTPMDVHAGSAQTGAFAVWSVRAPDDFADTIVYLVLLDRSDDCPATEAVPIARFRGAAAVPSVYASASGNDLVVLGLPLGADGDHELAALDVRCELTGE